MKGKQRSLNGLFWRYLLSTMALLAGVLLALWFVLLQLIRMGAVLPADTGARNLERTTVLLQAQETFDPGEIPFYYRWALADSSGILESNLSPKEETWAQKVLAGEVSRHGFLYTKYYWSVPLSGGRVCLLQYDYAVCYANPTLQERLPDFQLLFFLVCLGCLVLVALWRTHHYTKGLRRDAQAITLACNGVAQQTLDTPFPAQAQVRELQAALTALDTLRRELAASLQDQWAGEQQKQALLAALPLADCPSTRALRALHALFPHGDHHGQALGIAQADDLSGPLTLAFTMLTLHDTGCQGRFDSRTPLCGTEETICRPAQAALTQAGFTVQGPLDPPHHVPADSPFLQVLAKCYEQYSGRKSQCLAIGGGTYVHDIPGGVAFGASMPGFVSNLHGPDERVHVGDLLTAAKIYAQVILALCA